MSIKKQIWDNLRLWTRVSCSRFPNDLGTGCGWKSEGFAHRCLSERAVGVKSKLIRRAHRPEI